MRKNALRAAVAVVAGGLAAPSLAQETQVGIKTSLILEGIYFNKVEEGTESPAGFSGGHDHDHGDDHGHNHGLDEGFNLGHSELAFEARLGELLDGTVLLGFNSDDIEVDEAFLTTRSLPAGFQLKGGKFLSDVGYINSRHSHDWDFADRPLVNEHLFGGHGLQETGIQATWLAPTDTYTLLGVESLQGGDSKFGQLGESPVEEKAGPRMTTAFLKVGPDWGADHAAQFGVSGGYVSQDIVYEGHGDHGHAKEGESWFAGVDAVYKYASGRTQGHGDFRIAGEYYYLERDLTHHALHKNGDWERRNSDTEKQDGLYVEAVYGVAPRWEAGVRGEALGLTNDMLTGHFNSIESLDTSYRYSGQLTYRPVERAFVRAQVNHNDFADDHGHGDEGWEFMLQVNVALGAHGAHTF